MFKKDHYTHREVVKLLGLTETGGDAEITILDLLSWLRDSGGDPVWQRLAQENYPGEAWMAQRGPVAPDSTIACVVYDFFKGMRMLNLQEQAVVALTVFNFSVSEISEILGLQRTEVSQVLFGQPKRDQNGRVARDKRGRPVMHQGAVSKLTHNMNGHSPNGKAKKSNEPAEA